MNRLIEDEKKKGNVKQKKTTTKMKKRIANQMSKKKNNLIKYNTQITIFKNKASHNQNKMLIALSAHENPKIRQPCKWQVQD